MSPVNNTSSQLAYSYLQSKNKVSGLVSGMDIESMMEKLMKAEHAQMEKLQQQKQKYEWKRDAYRDVNTKLNTFQQDLFDKYSLKSSWNTKTVNVSANSSVNVKAGAGASGNLSITEVKLAEAAKSNFTNSSALTDKLVDEKTLLKDIKGINFDNIKNNGFDETSTLKDVTDNLATKGYNASIANGKLTISAKTDAQDLTSAEESVLKELGVNFNGRQSKALTFGDDNEVAKGSTKLSELGLSAGEFKFKVAGSDEVTISYDETDTLDSLSKKLKDNGLAMTINAKGEVSFKATNGKDLESMTQPFGDLKNTITSSDAKYTTAASDSNAQGTNTIKELLGTDAQDGMFTLSALQADGTMKDTTITYKATDTIDSLMQKINGSGAGVTAIFNDGQFSIAANNTGDNPDGAEVKLLTTVKDENGNDIENTSGGLELFGKLTSLSTSGSGGDPIALADGGSNASMTVNGVEYKQSSNVFNIAGYEIIATGDLNSNSSPIMISSTPDADKAVDKVKEFVEMYNSLIKDINTQTTDKKKVGYDPLTDAQKAEMSESEITKWEQAAKAGLLKGDTTLNKVVSNMRQALYAYGNPTGSSAPAGIKGETLASIGITTSKEWTDNGKLEIDETKLRAAIEKDPDILSRIFTGDGTKENPGVVSQMRTTAQDAVKTIEKSAGKATSTSDLTYSLGKTISTLDTKIEDWKDRLKKIEDRYWSQFSAMENAIQKANSQSSIFMQQ